MTSELRIASPPSKWASRKLLVAVLALVLVAVNRKLGLDLTEGDILALAGMAAAYVLGQGWVDGRQADAAVLDCGGLDYPMRESRIECAPDSPVPGRIGHAPGNGGAGRRLGGAPWPGPDADAEEGVEGKPFVKRQAGKASVWIPLALAVLMLALVAVLAITSN
jgi:hypothetical protein